MSTINYWCEYCATSFRSQKSLLQHQKRAKSCIKYRDALFSCQKCCIFQTKGIRNLDAHLNKCTAKPYIQATAAPNPLKEKVAELKTQLGVEKMRSSIYAALLTSHSKIDLDKLFTQEGKNIHILNLDPDTKIFLHQKIQPSASPKEQTVVCKKSTKYRRAPRNLESNPEPTAQDRTLIIKKIDKRSKESLGKLDTTGITEQCDILIKQLATSRTYSKILRQIRVKRAKLLGTLKLQNYTNVVRDHIRELKEIFQNKQQSEKKIHHNILSSLTPLEARLLRYPGYHDTQMDGDCRERLKTIVRYGRSFSKEFRPYSVQEVGDKLTTYSVAIFPIEKLIRWALINPYGFWNVVYVSWPKSKQEDPHSFYLLHKLDKDKRYWNMNCRLEDFTIDLISTLQPYLIKTFRELYYAVFSDNDYRPNALELSSFVADDCEQLARNIILLSQPRKVCNKLRKLLVAECTYLYTNQDHFRLRGDDVMQRKRFQVREKIEMVLTVSQLFDQVTDEQAVGFYKSRNTV